MPTSITKFLTFDGEEFPAEKQAQQYEDDIRKAGIELRELFFVERADRDFRVNHLPKVEPKLLDLIKSYPNEDAWKIMKSLHLAGDMIDERRNSVSIHPSWLEESGDDRWVEDSGINQI